MVVSHTGGIVTTRPLWNGSVPSMPQSAHLVLPPPFRAHLAGPGDILDLAEEKAALGAGTLLWRQDGGVLALALVLEPGPPLAATQAEAELGYLAGLAALCDMLAHHAQPERPVEIDWPDRVVYDKAHLAGARWRQGPVAEDGLPEWVIFAAEVIAERPGLADAGLHPSSTSLAEEEFPEAQPLIESFAAFFKLIIDRWSTSGREAVLRRVLDRVPGKDALQGASIRDGRLELPPLGESLDESRWRDAARGGPAW